MVSSISSETQTIICGIVVKRNSFFVFLEEFTAWQFAFEINWPLIQNEKGLIVFGKNIKFLATVARHHTPSLSRLFVAVKNLIFEGSTIHPECQWGKKSHYCYIKKLITLDIFFPHIIHLNLLQFPETYFSTFLRKALAISSEVHSSQSILSKVRCHIIGKIL